jgi:hypothetical protein
MLAEHEQVGQSQFNRIALLVCKQMASIISTDRFLEEQDKDANHVRIGEHAGREVEHASHILSQGTLGIQTLFEVIASGTQVDDVIVRGSCSRK